jgi:hypothetical protein
MKEIEDTRIKLQEDRAQLEISKQLQNKNIENGISRAEIDAAVKFAGVCYFFYFIVYALF